MARNTTIACKVGQPKLLTDGSVTAVRLQSDVVFTLLATTDTTAPTSQDGGITVLPNSVLGADYALEDLFPGVGSSVYLWAWPEIAIANVSISHA